MIGGFRSTLSVSVLGGQSIVAVIMIGGSEIRKSLAGSVMAVFTAVEVVKDKS